jgi:hypothetical protein
LTGCGLDLVVWSSLKRWIENVMQIRLTVEPQDHILARLASFAFGLAVKEECAEDLLTISKEADDGGW